MDDLIEYLNIIRIELESNKNIDFPTQLLMEEVCDIATNNWVETGNPQLTVEQFYQVIARTNPGEITLN